MACSEPGGCKILLYFGFFMLAAGTFCHCSQLARLKTLIQARHKPPLIADKSDFSYSGWLLVPQQIAQLNKDTSHILDDDSDYQADAGGSIYWQPSLQEDFSKDDKVLTDQLIKMDPKVECRANSMKLQVQDFASTPGSLILVDRGNLSPLPLSMLPQSCGYTIMSTRREMVLVAPYDGCFVTLQENAYVLPLLWWGFPVRMICPLIPSSPNPPMVTCHTDGMIVKTEWTIPLSRIKIKVNGKWEFLTAASSKCRINLAKQGEGVIMSVHYGHCVKKKDGLYTLELAGEGEAKVSCPSMAPGLSPPTKSPSQEPLQTLNVGLYPSYPFSHSQSSPNKPVIPHKLKPIRQPFKLEASPVPERQPGYPLFPVPQHEKADKPTPAPHPSQTPDTPPYLFPYPLNPTPGPVVKPLQKPTTAPTPHHPEGPPDHVEKPYPFLPENKPSKETMSVQSPKPTKTQPEVPSGHLEESYPFLPKPHPEYKPSKAIKTVPSPHPPKFQQPKVPGPVKSYPFLPNPQSENKPRKETKGAPSPQPPKPRPPEVPSDLHKPYPFLPNPQTETKSKDRKTVPSPQEAEVQPAQGAQPASPNKPPETPEANPTPSQQFPEAPTVPAGHPLYPYFYQFFPGTDDKPQPSQPHEPEKPKGKVQRPVHLFPSKPLLENGHKPNDKRIPVPQWPEDPLDQILLPTYPLYPMPSPKESFKKPKVPPGHVHKPIYPYPYPYPLYPWPVSKEPAKKPIREPKIPMVPAGPVQQPPNPYPYPLYPIPRPKKPTKQIPHSQNPEATPGRIKQPPELYPYPVNSTHRPKEPTRKPMPKPRVTPGPVQQPPNPYTYPKSSSEEPTKKPLHNLHNPEVLSSPMEQPTEPYPYPLYPIPSPREPAIKPILELWPVKPQMPEVPHGSVKQPTDPYLYPLYPKPGLKQPSEKTMPNQWSLKPQLPKIPPGQVKQPTDPYHFLPYPKPSPEKTTKPRLVQWPFKPQESEAPLSPVEWSVSTFWHQNKPVAKPAQDPQTSVFPQSWVPQLKNPYLVYPIPSSGDYPKKTVTFLHPPDSRQPEVPGHVHQQANLYYPFNVGAVNKPPGPLKPEVPGNLFWPLEPQSPVKHISTHLIKQTTEGEKLSPIQLPESKIPRPQWQQYVTLPPGKKPHWAIPLLQPSNGAVVPPGSASGCLQFCTGGFSNCCPQIAFHQHLYLSRPGASDKVTHTISQEFPYVASVAYYVPGNGMGYGKNPENHPEKNVDSVANEKQPYHQSPGSNSASLLGGIPNMVPSEQQSYPYLATKTNSQYSGWLYKNSSNLAPPKLSPQVMPFGVQNEFYAPVNQEARNEHPKKQNYQLSPRVTNYPSGVNPNIGKYLQQHNSNRMQIFSYDSDRPTHSEVQDDLHPLLPYSMVNDAEVIKNSSFLQNLPQSHWNKPKKFFKRHQTERSSEPKGYVLLQHGPPGKAPGWSLGSRNFKVGIHDQNVPVQHSARLQRVNTWNWKPLLGKGLTKSSRNHFEVKSGPK
ncbi:adhesive plaque matrix protein-like [Syngnathoides biaculeatus]|uniref:adhesive plaque matrix protein-like n=1 Tax=Syngnathoides biaculeatus TaxID=300417 RepID=UPI002ADD9425|nr:adhesive plaque matrix protein-like [Syngnathoides biaculeatus]